MAALMMLSGSMPSASPSKERMSLWRRAGSATASTSSLETWYLPSSSALARDAARMAWAARGEAPFLTYWVTSVVTFSPSGWVARTIRTR